MDGNLATTNLNVIGVHHRVLAEVSLEDGHVLNELNTEGDILHTVGNG